MAAEAATQTSLNRTLMLDQHVLRPANRTSSQSTMHHNKNPAVYILASRSNGTLYVGVTSDLHDRMQQHTLGLIDGFSKRYNVKLLVYNEHFETMREAIDRETQLKKWHRLWKLRLIEGLNPEWLNLFDPETGVIAFGSGDRCAFEEPDR